MPSRRPLRQRRCRRPWSLARRLDPRRGRPHHRRMRLRVGAAACWVVLLSGCGRVPFDVGGAHFDRYSSPIVGGAVDSGHPAVLLIYNSFGGYLCTGTLIDTYVVLTAAHCTQDTVASHYQVAGGVNPTGATGADWVTTALQVTPNSQFNINNLGAGHDFGVVVIDGTQVQPAGHVLPTHLAWQSSPG